MKVLVICSASISRLLWAAQLCRVGFLTSLCTSLCLAGISVTVSFLTAATALWPTHNATWKEETKFIRGNKFYSLNNSMGNKTNFSNSLSYIVIFNIQCCWGCDISKWCYTISGSNRAHDQWLILLPLITDRPKQFSAQDRLPPEFGMHNIFWLMFDEFIFHN